MAKVTFERGSQPLPCLWSSCQLWVKPLRETFIPRPAHTYRPAVAAYWLTIVLLGALLDASGHYAGSPVPSGAQDLQFSVRTPPGADGLLRDVDQPDGRSGSALVRESTVWA